MSSARLLFVIAIGRSDLADLLRRQFADVAESVEIVRDRRGRERRTRHIPVGKDRRAMTRRRHDVRDDLDSIGWALVRRGA